MPLAMIFLTFNDDLSASTQNVLLSDNNKQSACAGGNSDVHRPVKRDTFKIQLFYLSFKMYRLVILLQKHCRGTLSTLINVVYTDIMCHVIHTNMSFLVQLMPTVTWSFPSHGWLLADFCIKTKSICNFKKLLNCL